MSDSLHARSQDTFRDLVPWADPYIAALIDKLRRTDAAERLIDATLVNDLASSIDDVLPDRENVAPSAWLPRNWPRG